MLSFSFLDRVIPKHNYQLAAKIYENCHYVKILYLAKFVIVPAFDSMTESPLKVVLSGLGLFFWG